MYIFALVSINERTNEQNRNVDDSSVQMLRNPIK